MAKSTKKGQIHSDQEVRVSYKVAQLAKDRGFDIPVRYSYGHKINPHIAYPNSDYSIPGNFNDNKNQGRNWEGLISAPTQVVLQRWMRRTHRVHTSVNHVTTPFEEHFEGTYGKDAQMLAPYITFEEWEDCLETILEEGLSLIKPIK